MKAPCKYTPYYPSVVQDREAARNILAAGHAILACGEIAQSGFSMNQEPPEAILAYAERRRNHRPPGRGGCQSKQSLQCKKKSFVNAVLEGLAWAILFVIVLSLPQNENNDINDKSPQSPQHITFSVRV